MTVNPFPVSEEPSGQFETMIVKERVKFLAFHFFCPLELYLCVSGGLDGT